MFGNVCVSRFVSLLCVFVHIEKGVVVELKRVLICVNSVLSSIIDGEFMNLKLNVEVVTQCIVTVRLNYN